MRERRSKPNTPAVKPDTMTSGLQKSKTKSNDPKGNGMVMDQVSLQKLSSAIQWVVDERDYDWGWGQDTAQTVLALALANSSWFNEKNLEAQLVAKQFEMELILRLWK